MPELVMRLINEREINPPRGGQTCMRPVVLIHGIFDSGTKFDRMANFLNERGFQPLSPSLSPSSGKVGLDELALQLRAFVNERIPSQEPFDLIGFSMGGLISRYYLQRLGGMERVRRFITISSPHRGSYWAYLINNAACRQMRPGSVFLEELNRDREMLEQVRFVSLWTQLDLMIVPASSSRLDVGEEIVLQVAAHPLMVTSRLSLESIVKLLQEETIPQVPKRR